MKEFEDRKEFEKIFEVVRNNIKEKITAKGVSMKGSAKGTALSEIIAVFDEELELGIAEELRKGRGLIRAYYRKYNEVESLEVKLRENEQKLEAQQKVTNMVSLLTDDTLKNAIVAYEALSDRRGRSDAKEIVIAYIESKGREDLMDTFKAERKDEPQTEIEIAKAIVHKMIDDAVIAEDAYPDLRQKMRDAVDEYEPRTETKWLQKEGEF